MVLLFVVCAVYGAPMPITPLELDTARCATCPQSKHTAHAPAPSVETLLLSAKGDSSSPPLSVAFAAEPPLTGVTLAASESLIKPVMEANIDYLLTSFDIDHILQPFRIRAGG